MIYSNVKIASEEREFSFGKMTVIALGEKGRGRREIVLPCPKDTVLKEGLNEGLTIGFSKSGKPKIVSGYDSELYYVLSSYGGYTRRGNGTIYIIREGEKHSIDAMDDCLEYGNGADGDAGRIGDWQVIVMKPRATDVISLKYSGGLGNEFREYIFGTVTIKANELELALDSGKITEEQFRIAENHRDRK